MIIETIWEGGRKEMRILRGRKGEECEEKGYSLRNIGRRKVQEISKEGSEGINKLGKRKGEKGCAKRS